LPWNAYYDKELDVRFSRSYGPGRYDDRYELEGIDYPAGYVRWTERRNLACFVDLLERGLVPEDLLVSGRFPIEQATDVYERIAEKTLDGIGLLFEYPAATTERESVVAARVPTRAATISAPTRLMPRRAGGATKVGFIGAGNYAT